MGKRPNITLQVVPFSADAHPALSGAFTLLSFDQGYPDVAYVEAIGGELLVDSIDGVDRYHRVFPHLAAERFLRRSCRPHEVVRERPPGLSRRIQEAASNIGDQLAIENPTDTVKWVADLADRTCPTHTENPT